MSEGNPLITTETGALRDWTLCCLCQERTKKDLRCPFKKDCHHKAYQSLEDDLRSFVENDAPLPLGLNLKDVDDGSGH